MSTVVITLRYVSIAVITLRYVSTAVITLRYVSTAVITFRYVSTAVITLRYELHCLLFTCSMKSCEKFVPFIVSLCTGVVTWSSGSCRLPRQ